MQSVTYTIARPDTGAVLPYAVVSVFEQDGSSLAQLFDAEGAAMGNPVTADATGAITIAAANGTYVLRAVSADGTLTLPDLTVQVFDLQTLANAIAAGGVAGVVEAKYATEAAMRADLTKAADTIALVYGDSDPLANDLYYKIGATGSGSWSGPLGLLAGLSYNYALLAAFAIPFDLRSDLLDAPGGGLRATVAADTGTHTAVSGEVALGGGAATVGAAIPNNGRYTRVSGAWLRTGDTEEQLAAAQADRSRGYADDLAEIVESLDVGISTDLFVFKDGDDNIVGRVKPDAKWDILLDALKRADGLEITHVETVGDSSPLVIVDAESNVLYEAQVETGDDPGAEIIAARGTRTALGDRLSQSLDAYGSPLDSFNANRLRRLHYKRRKRLLSEAVQLHIGLFGDSFTHNRARYSGDLAATLISEMGDAGGGWTGFGFITGSPAGPYVHGGTQPSFTNGNARSAYGVSHNGAWTGAYGNVPSPDTCCAISSTAGNEIRATFPASPTLSGVDLFWIGTADGVMEYSWDGTSWTTINVQGTVGACSFAALTGFPSGVSGTLRLSVVSGECRPAGVNWKSAASGVVVHKLAATGSRMQQLATQAAVASWRAAVAALGIDTAIVMHGTNDQGASRTPAQFAADAQTVLNNLQTAIPGVDRMIAMPPENQRVGNAVAMSAYKAAVAPVAAEANVAFLDHQRNFGDPANPTEYGSAGATPLFNTDLIHPEPATGGKALLDGFVRFFGAA